MTKIAGLYAVRVRVRVGAKVICFSFFIDSSKAAFGHKPLLEKIDGDPLWAKKTGSCATSKMYNLINEVNGSGMVWAVLGPGYTRLAMGQLAPEVQQFPEAAKLVQRMQAMIITANASSGMDAKVPGGLRVAREDANTLSQLMAAGLLYKKYQASKDNPELGAVAGSGQRDAFGGSRGDSR